MRRDVAGGLTFGGFQPNHYVRDCLAITTERVLSLLRCELCYLALVNFLVLFYPEADGTAKVLQQGAAKAEKSMLAAAPPKKQ